jgi:Sugar phosphate permease
VALAALAHGVSLPLLGAYGVFATPLVEEFGASTTQLGLGMSIALLAIALVSAPLGALFDRGPLRTIMLAGAMLMFTSVLALSRSVELWQLAVGFACAAVGISMYGASPVHVVLVNWFSKRRGTALSLAHVGTSVGSLIVLPTTSWLIEWLGWRNALVALAAGALSLALPVIARFVKRPEDLGQTPDGVSVEPAAASLVPRAGDGPSGASQVGGWLRDSNFWLIGGGAGLAFGVSIAILFLVRHLETLGIPRTRAAMIPASIGAFGIVGKVAAGWLVDRFEPRAVVVGTLVLQALGWAIVASPSSFTWTVVASALIGVGSSGFLPLPPVLQARCFGRDAIGRIGGLHGLIGLPFLLSAAPLVGWGEGRTGGFAVPFYGLAVALVLAAAALACVRVPEVELVPAVEHQ